MLVWLLVVTGLLSGSCAWKPVSVVYLGQVCDVTPDGPHLEPREQSSYKLDLT